MTSADWRDERGQSILLLPAGFLIVLVLGALVLEAGALHLQQRRLDDLADSIANDVSGAAFDTAAFRESGEVRIVPATAASMVAPAISLSMLPDASGSAVVIPGDPPLVVVELRFEHQPVMGRTVFDERTLTATGTAALVLGSSP